MASIKCFKHFFQNMIINLVVKTVLFVTSSLNSPFLLVGITFLLYCLQVYESHASTDGLLRDFCDGEDFKQHDLFGNYPYSLILHCYYDEFQVDNPLGSKD